MELKPKPAHRFVKYFIVGSFIEATRLLSFHLFFGSGESWAGNLYSLVVSLLFGFPLVAWLVWPDRPGSRWFQAIKYVGVWLLGVAIKLPIFELLKPGCLAVQPFLNNWRLLLDGWLPGLGFFSSLVSKCPNLLAATLDLLIAVGLKYYLYDKVVFVANLVVRRVRKEF